LFHKCIANSNGNNNGKCNRNCKNNRNNNNNGNRNRKNNGSNNRKGNDMAIVHVSFKSSSKAPPAAAHAQYIAREGQYQQRGGVELVESGNMPEFAQADPHAFWVAADAYERTNGRTYTELQIALPRELNPTQREELARETTRELLGDRFAYTMAVHVPLAKDNIDQPHMHLMFSERVMDSNTQSMSEEQFFKRNGAKKDRSWNDRNKPDEVREKWVEMMNGAMQKAGLELRVDARSWAEQGREDLAALVEEKTLRGDGPEAQERLEKIAEQRQMRAELPAPHLDQAAAVEELEKRAEQDVARIEQRRDEQISLLDKLIEKARELAVEVKERTTEFARNVVDRVESFFGAGKQENLPFTASLKEQEQARSPSPPTEEQLEKSLAGLDKKIAMRESFDAQLAGLDKRMEAEARALQEKELRRSQEISPARPEKEVEIEHEHRRGFGIGR
jgi:MobA/MobL family